MVANKTSVLRKSKSIILLARATLQKQRDDQAHKLDQVRTKKEQKKKVHDENIL